MLQVLAFKNHYEVLMCFLGTSKSQTQNYWIQNIWKSSKKPWKFLTSLVSSWESFLLTYSQKLPNWNGLTWGTTLWWIYQVEKNIKNLIIKDAHIKFPWQTIPTLKSCCWTTISSLSFHLSSALFQGSEFLDSGKTCSSFQSTWSQKNMNENDI